MRSAVKMVLWLATWLTAAPAAGADQDTGPAAVGVFTPRIALIIDDLGDRWREHVRAINLPAAATYAILPHTTYAVRLAELAHRSNKQVMLHLPMEAMGDPPASSGQLRLDMTESHFRSTLLRNLAAIPHAAGINNHQGSLLTRHPGHMLWLMQEIQHRGNLFFVDSRTTAQTVALQVARENGIPSIERDVFLDHDRNEATIALRLYQLAELAMRQGHAVGIGHPYPETLAVLERHLPVLRESGWQFVLVSELLDPPSNPLLVYREQESVNPTAASSRRDN